jgi:hypothetical protein
MDSDRVNLISNNAPRRCHRAAKACIADEIAYSESDYSTDNEAVQEGVEHPSTANPFSDYYALPETDDQAPPAVTHTSSHSAPAMVGTRITSDEEDRAEVQVLEARLETTKVLTRKIQASLARLNTSGQSVQDAIGPIYGRTDQLQVMTKSK